MTVRSDDVLTALVATAQAVFGAAACSVAVLDAEGEELVFRAASGQGAESVVGLRLPSTQGIAGWAVMSGQTLAVGEVASDARFARDAAEQTGYIPQTILAAPLIHDGEALGVIEVLDPSGERSLELLGRFADQAALVLAWDAGAGSGSGSGRAGRDAAEEALLQAAIDYARGR